MNVLIHLGGIFDFDRRKEELEEVNRDLEQPGVWDDPETTPLSSVAFAVKPIAASTHMSISDEADAPVPGPLVALA